MIVYVHQLFVYKDYCYFETVIYMVLYSRLLPCFLYLPCKLTYAHSHMHINNGGKCSRLRLVLTLQVIMRVQIFVS